MDLTFAFDTYYLILLHISSIFILLFVNFSIWLKAKKIPLLYSYIAVQGILLFWMISKVFKTVAPDVSLKFFFVLCQYAVVCFLGEAFFIFAFLYAKGRLPAKKYIILMALPAVAFLVILATNPYHLLFYSHFDFWSDSFGPAFYIHQAYSYTLISLGMLLCVGNHRRQFGEKRAQSLLLAAAIAIPLIANVIYVFGWFRRIFGFSPPCDITPISCNISLMVFALATFKYRFFDEIRVARRHALATIPDGILLIDSRRRVVDFNDTFKNMAEGGGLHPKDDSGIFRKPDVKLSFAAYEMAPFLRAHIAPCDTSYEAENGSFYRLICRDVLKKNRACGSSVRVVDLTLTQAILSKMEEKNQRLTVLNQDLNERKEMIRSLAVARTRNFIAGEAHDILGHSVVLVISMLEVARYSLGKDGFDFGRCIARCEELLYDCLRRISLVGRSGGDVSQSSLADRLTKLSNDVRPAAVDVDIWISGDVGMLSGEREDAVFKLCREGVTNAIRHGKAGKINIILRVRSARAEVYVIDNGAGCGKLVKGMGITGMERRLNLLGGSLTCGELDGCGFCLQAELPVR